MLSVLVLLLCVLASESIVERLHHKPMSVQTITRGTFIMLMLEQGQCFAQARLYHTLYVRVNITDLNCLDFWKKTFLFYSPAQY